MISLDFHELLLFSWNFTSGRVGEFYRQLKSDTVTVTTKSGPVRGYKIPTEYNYEYMNFHGIPYAKPPINELRFKVCLSKVTSDI